MKKSLRNLAKQALKVSVLGLALAGVLVVPGCAFITHEAPVKVPYGGIVQITKAPLQYDFNDPETPALSPVKGTSVGHFIRIPIMSPFLTFAWGDSSIKTATMSMNKVHYADYELFNVLSIYQRFTVEAYGE